MNLQSLISHFTHAGCTKLYAKMLAENDNSKNQVYFGPGFEALNLFPNSGVFADGRANNSTFKAKLNFGWLIPGGGIAEAPRAQLILYPQYPEVRFSGFLGGCKIPPSDLMRNRFAGRILFLGVTPARRIIGYVAGPGTEIAREFKDKFSTPISGVFHHLDLLNVLATQDSREQLLAELRRIHKLGWIDSKQLDSSGRLSRCDAPQCGGFTLEAELGIPKNSSVGPDFLGWEVKQHNVTSFNKVEAGTITLMTPEPTGGFYCEHGPEAFVRKYGYPDKLARDDRLNFGGIHRANVRHTTTRLTMLLDGYNAQCGRITDASGCIALVSDDGEVAASWSFEKILEHWSHKHTKAVYVPSQCRKVSQRQYAYGHKVRLAEGTDSLRLLGALAQGNVYYDPGIKLECVSKSPKLKRRNQFRVFSRNIKYLYRIVSTVEV